ncbi:hypothetical protein POV27_06290 [Aureisphaera galaxeae]|uniref:TolB family protein n=1 Tax=Aureisphaera galaxeae TaxID=1538023 RepID=UPI002350909C|nr:hypothetical protein [Aureisphaera galaxeae]MDC8003653.1 hypothetical protein [Aureisphaera galaxeae]
MLQLFIVASCDSGQASGKPVLFEPNNVSTEIVEYGPSFSASGQEMYFARSADKWGQGPLTSAIYHSVKENEMWSKPELVSFSGVYDDSDPHITNDRNTLYFISKRASETGQTSADIWKVNKDEDGKWGTPIRLQEPINSEGNEYSPKTDDQGNLYFASDRSGGYGQGDLYVAKTEGGQFAAPANLGDAVNTDQGEWNLEISRDGKILIFEASGRPENVSSYGDLYISFKENDGWTVPQNITELNTSGSDLSACLTNKNKTLYYASSDSIKNPSVNIYRVDFKTIFDHYKKNATATEK